MENNERKQLSEEEVAKIKWIMELFGFLKELQTEIHKKERSKRYFAIFVSGCITYFIANILFVFMQTESSAVVFFSAFVSLCLHYIIDNIESAWTKAINIKKFHKQLAAMEKERLDLGITDEDLNFGDQYQVKDNKEEE
jgi:hypothetical protein